MTGTRELDFVIVSGYTEAEERADWRLLLAFRAAGYRVGLLAGYEDYREACRARDIPFMNLVAGRRPRWSGRTRAFLRRAFAIDDAREFVFTEHTYYHQGIPGLLRKAALAGQSFSRFIRRNRVGCFVQRLGGEIHRRIVFAGARKQGIPVVYLGESLFKDRMTLYLDELNSMPDFRFDADLNLSDPERAEMRAYLCGFTAAKKVYRYLKRRNPAGGFSITSVRRLFNHLRQGAWDWLAVNVRYKFEFLVQRPLYSVLNRRHYRPLPESPFVFFPFHVMNDAQLTIRNRGLFHQDRLVADLAKAVPTGYRLVVKMHPGIYGLLPPDMVARIARTRNVTLVDPDIHSHDVIRRSAGVVHINSTVGFEALHFRVPVLTVGNWNIARAPLIETCRDLARLSGLLASRVGTEVDEEMTLRFLHQLRAATWPGSLYTETIDFPTIVTSVAARVAGKGPPGVGTTDDPGP